MEVAGTQEAAAAATGEVWAPVGAADTPAAAGQSVLHEIAHAMVGPEHTFTRQACQAWAEVRLQPVGRLGRPS